MDESDQRNILMETAILGKQAEMFVNSDIGKYLLARAEEKSRICYDQLKKVAPWRQKRIRDLQNEIWKCESFRTWILESINEGQFAQEEMLER
jgi:hypothetical protein